MFNIDPLHSQLLNIGLMVLVGGHFMRKPIGSVLAGLGNKLVALGNKLVG